MLVGFWVGILEGCREGDCDGVTVGELFDGTLLGDGDGSEDRLPVGFWVGSIVGFAFGSIVRHVDGFLLGAWVETGSRLLVNCCVGLVEGCEGSIVGFPFNPTTDNSEVIIVIRSMIKFTCWCRAGGF